MTNMAERIARLEQQTAQKRRRYEAPVILVQFVEPGTMKVLEELEIDPVRHYTSRPRVPDS